MASSTRPTVPTVSPEEQRSMDAGTVTHSVGVQAARMAEARAQQMTAKDEILAVIEDMVNYVAARGRGITVATPARRALRQAIERDVVAFLDHEVDTPPALDQRAEARVLEIVRQAVTARDASVSVSVEATGSEPPPPPPDRGLARG